MLRLLHSLVVTLLMVLLPSILFAQVGPPDPPSDGPNGCAEAPLICDITTLSGYQGGTGPTGQGAPCPFAAAGSTCPNSTCENNIWFNFFANATTMDIDIMVSNCEGGTNGNGLQGAMYQVTDCSSLSGFIPVSNCFSNGTPTDFTLNATGLIVGEIYTIMLDGFAGSNCQFEIGEIGGPNVPFPELPGPLEGPLEVCPGAEVEYCMPIGTGIQEYQWTLPTGAVIQDEYFSPDGSMICIEVEFTGPGGGALEVLGINECYDENYGTNFQVLAPIISAPIPIDLTEDQFCIGETYDWECWTNISIPGFYECVYDSWLGCDSTLQLLLTPHPVTPPVFEWKEICSIDAPYIWNGQEYFDTGTYFYEYYDAYGCLVTDQLILNVYESESIISAPDVIGCGQDSIVTLDASLSTSYPQDSINGGSVNYLWTTSDGNILSDPTQMTVDVNAAGEYFFEVIHSNFIDTVSCLSISSVIVLEDNAFPDAPGISGTFEICGTGQLETYIPIPSTTGVPATGYVWTATGGSLVTSGNDATVTWASSGQICLAAYNACDTSDFTCIDVTVGAAPVIPAIVGPTTVCETNDSQEYSIVANDWVDVWTVTGGATFVPNPGSNLITVDFTGVVQPSVEICVTAENDCGISNPLCQTITIIQVPNDPVISGDDAVCLNDTETYSIESDPAILSIVATVPGGLGTIISGQGTTDVEIEWTTSGSDQVCFEVSNPCGSANVVCQDITISDLPTASLVDADIYYCPGSSDTATVNITLTGLSPWEVVLTDGTNLTTYNLTDANSSIDIVGAGSYTISSVIDGNTCIGSGIGQINIIEHTAPTALLSGSGGICEDSGDCIDLTVDLDQEPGWTIVYAIDGIEQAPVSGIMTSPYTLTLCQSGTITLVSVEDGNGCSGTVSGTALIDNLTTPTANVETYCEPGDDTQYFVSIEIQGGDPSSYTVLPIGSGTLVGNIFTSNPILSATPYSFQVFDGNACETLDLTGNYVCNCGNDVGVMDQTLLNICDPDCAAVIYDNTNEILAAGDIAQYVLHEGAGISIVNPIAFNATGAFCFDSGSMVYGQTYYISRITGDDDGNGGVDLSDLCLAVAQGTPVRFFELPDMTAGIDGSICLGETYDIQIDFSSGASPWNVVYTNNVNGLVDTLTGITANPYTFTVSPVETTSYTFTEIYNANCSQVENELVLVEVNESPSVTAVTTSCNNTADGFVVSFEIVGGNPTTYQVLPVGSGTLVGNVFTSNEIPEGNNYFFEVTNGFCDIVEVSDPNPVDCPCLSMVGTLSMGPVEVCGDGPIDLIYDSTNEFTDGNDVLGFILYEGTSTNITNVIQTNSTSPSFSFVPGMTYGQTYYIAAAVGNDNAGLPDLTDLCLDITNGVEVVYFEIPTINMTGDAAICFGESTDLEFIFTGDAPFEVTINDGTSDIILSDIVSSPFIYAVSPSTTTTYTLIAGSDEHCTALINGSATIQINDAPTTSNVTETINIDNTHVTASFDISGGTLPYVITYSNGDTSLLNSNQFVFDSIPCGNGYYFEVDDLNGCGPVIISAPSTDCPCITTAGDILEADTMIVCNDMVSFTYDNTNEYLDGNDAVQYIIHNGDGVPILFPQDDLDFEYTNTLDYGTLYTVSVIAGDSLSNGAVNDNDPCYDLNDEAFVIFYEEPNAILSGGGDICLFDSMALYVEFTAGIGPWTIVVENSQNGALDTVELDYPQDSFFVDPMVTATFSLVSVFDSVNACTGSVGGTVNVQVNSVPYASNIDVLTNYVDEYAEVTFTITGGDQATYQVVDADGNIQGTIDGPYFTSFPYDCVDISGGILDTFYISDQYGCITDEEIVSIECECLTSIGNFDQSSYAYCSDENIVFDSIQIYTLDGNDVVNFLLVDDPLNYSNPIMTSTTASFDYDPALIDCDNSYYVLGVAGDDDGNGIVDLTDQCLAISDPMSIIVQCPIAFEFIQDTIEICIGEPALVGTQSNGDGPFALTINTPAGSEVLSGVINGDQLTFEPTVSGTYQLTYVMEETSDLLCGNAVMDEVHIIVYEPGEVGSIGFTPQFCEGESGLVTLSEVLTGEDSGGTWTAAGAYFGFNATLGTFNPEGNPAGEYLFTYTLAGEASCPDSSIEVPIQIHAIPTADAGIDGLITCNVSDVLLGGTGTSMGDEYIYTWTLNGATIAGAESSTYEATSAGTYELMIQNSITGCSASDVVLVENIVEVLIPDIQFNDPLCFEEENGSINVVDVLGGQEPYLYSFDGGQTFSSNSDMDGLGSSTYSVIVQDANGCQSQQVEVTLEAPGELIVELEILNEIQEDNSIMYGDSVVLFANVNNPAVDITYDWMPGCDTCGSIYVLNPTTTTMVNISIDANGCDADDRILILVRKDEPVFVPTVFSPNGDNVNDVLNIYIGEFVKEVKSFQIYDRWGELMHSRTNFVPTNQTYDDSAWDGTLNGKSCGAGVYVYFIEVEFQDGHIEMYKGDITLTR